MRLIQRIEVVAVACVCLFGGVLLWWSLGSGPDGESAPVNRSAADATPQVGDSLTLEPEHAGGAPSPRLLLTPTGPPGPEARDPGEAIEIHAMAVEAATASPVANATIGISLVDERGRVDGHPVEARTDSHGTAQIPVDPRGLAQGSRWIVNVAHDSLIPIGFPRLYEGDRIPLDLVVPMAAELFFDGTVYDPSGAPVSDAHVSLGWTSTPLPPRWVSSTKLATTSKDGTFHARHDGRIPSDSFLIVYHPSYPPKHVTLPWDVLSGTNRCTFSIILDKGARLSLSVVDEFGQPVGGAKLDLVSQQHATIPEFMPLPGIAPEYSGANALEGVTDASGVFESAGWRIGEAVRIMVVSTPATRWRILQVDPGSMSKDGTWGVTRVEDTRSAASVRLSRVGTVIVRFTGAVRGLTDAERGEVRVLARYTEDAALAVTLEWLDAETVVGKLSIPIERFQGAEYYLDMYFGRPTPGTEKVRVGPYGITGSTDLGKIVFR